MATCFVTQSTTKIATEIRGVATSLSFNRSSIHWRVFFFLVLLLLSSPVCCPLSLCVFRRWWWWWNWWLLSSLSRNSWQLVLISISVYSYCFSGYAWLGWLASSSTWEEEEDYVTAVSNIPSPHLSLAFLFFFFSVFPPSRHLYNVCLFIAWWKQRHETEDWATATIKVVNQFL